MIGQRLAHYEITALLGEGGMGAVYRATDTKLGREVAVKVLTGLGDHAPERLARFRQEARAIAALNHPNIVTLHAVEEDDGVPFLVMELIEGAPLTARARDDGLDLDELLAIALPMADAVSTAHRQGITHRDLKPDNVMIDTNGRVKVLDFGLAKLLEAGEAGDDQRTIAIHRTQEGRILGTAAYMSPEQAEGKPVDARSDVFSLGILLYQLSTGRKPFDGETAISTISSIVKDQPPSALELNRALPRHLGRILDRCLAKDPDRRYQSALELRNELELLDRDSKSGELEMWVPAAETGASTPKKGDVALPVVVGLVLVVAAVAFLGARAIPDAGPPDGSPLLTSVEPLTTQGRQAGYPSLSPSGDLFVYEAVDGEDKDIFVQRLGGQRPIQLTADHDGEDRRPALSPDGQRIVFESVRDGGGIYVMGTTGERVRRVSPVGHDPAWSPDGAQIVYTTSRWDDPSGRDTEGVLHVMGIEVGSPRAVTPAGMDAVQPDWSPDGGRIVFWSVQAPNGQRDLYSIGVDGEGLVRLTADEALDYSPRYGPEGRSVWFVSNRTGTFNLWRLPIDPTTGEPRGEAAPVTLPNDNVARFDVRAGRIAFAAPDMTSRAVRIDRPAEPGALSDVRTLTEGTHHVLSPQLSPDGTRLSFYTPIGTGDQDLYVVHADGSQVRRITDDAYRDRGATWHPDGDRIVFYSDRGGAYDVWTIRPDGSDAQRISDVEELGMDSPWYPRYSSDARLLTTMNESGTTLWRIDPASGRMTDPRKIVPPVDGNFFTQFSWHPTESVVLGWIGDVPASNTLGLWTYDVDRDLWTHLVERIDDPWLAACFSSDGASVVLESGGRILTLDLDGAPFSDLGDPRVRILAEGIETSSLTTAPDGSWLLASDLERRSEVWGATWATSSNE